MCSCKGRRFVEALRSSWIFTFALFLFASAFFGLICCARTASVFTPQDLFKRLEILPRSVLVSVCSDRKLTVDLGGQRKKYLIGCQISSSKIILVRFHKK